MTELIPIEPANALAVFTEPEQLQVILDSIAADVRKEALDPSTAKGRKEIASLAFKIAKSKTYLDGEGKRLVDEYKELPRRIDAQRKAARDFLDGLRDEIRAPLEKWEADEAARKAAEEAAAAAEKLRAEIELAHEVALMMNEAFDMRRAREIEQAKREQAERDERIRQEAEARARKEAELAIENARLQQERAERERADAERRAAEAEQREKERAERAEQERIEAEAREKARAEQAEIDRIAAAKRAEEQAAAAVQRAKEQAEREEQARIAAQQKLDKERLANQEHRRSINRAALVAILAAVPGVGEQQAKDLILAIGAGKIPAVSINY